MAKVYDLQEVEVWDGNVAASHALRQAQIDVMAAYPITPSTPIVQDYGTFVGNGYIDGEFVLVESEHAAMSGCVGAAAAGGRVATATSSQGLALMVEVLYQASSMRLPIVLNLVNRALAAPLNIHGDLQICIYAVMQGGFSFALVIHKKLMTLTLWRLKSQKTMM